MSDDDWMPADYYEAVQTGWPMEQPPTKKESEMTPTERLREAAQVLRDRAEPDDSPLALALADWLDEADNVGDGFIPDEAFRVADAVLGGADR